MKFGGLKFLDLAHVKDLLACLRLAENPSDRVAGFRVLQLVPGVGPAMAEAALNAMAGAAEPAAALAAAAVPRRAAEAWADFAELYRGLRRGSPWPAELGAVRAWYEPELERLHADAAVRRADLAQLEAIAAGFATRERFLTEITLDPPGAVSDEAGVPLKDEDFLILSTIHSAKGQEWSRVTVLNCVDGCIPSDLGTGTSAELEEERRLLYVAMTRARDALTLVTPQKFHVHGQHRLGDRHVYASRSRFLPATILDRFERRTWPVAAPAAAGPARAPRAPVDLASRMRGMWE